MNAAVLNSAECLKRNPDEALHALALLKTTQFTLKKKHKEHTRCIQIPDEIFIKALFKAFGGVY